MRLFEPKAVKKWKLEILVGEGNSLFKTIAAETWRQDDWGLTFWRHVDGHNEIVAKFNADKVVWMELVTDGE